MVTKSKVSIATSRTSSKGMKTSIPIPIIEFLGLNIGDYMNWTMRTENDKRFIVVYKDGEEKEENV